MLRPQRADPHTHLSRFLAARHYPARITPVVWKEAGSGHPIGHEPDAEASSAGVDVDGYFIGRLPRAFYHFNETSLVLFLSLSMPFRRQ